MSEFYFIDNISENLCEMNYLSILTNVLTVGIVSFVGGWLIGRVAYTSYRPAVYNVDLNIGSINFGDFLDDDDVETSDEEENNATDDDENTTEDEEVNNETEDETDVEHEDSVVNEPAGPDDVVSLQGMQFVSENIDNSGAVEIENGVEMEDKDKDV